MYMDSRKMESVNELKVTEKIFLETFRAYEFR